MLDDEVLVNLKTVELPWRNNQRRVSCIKAGTYPVIVGHASPKFGWTIWLQNVPNRSEILIHRTSFVRQLLGCIAPGLFHKDIDNDGIMDASNSRDAMQVMRLYFGQQKESRIEIIDPPNINDVETHTGIPDWTDYLTKN